MARDVTDTFKPGASSPSGKSPSTSTSKSALAAVDPDPDLDLDPAPDLVQELDHFRREWLHESQLKLEQQQQHAEHDDHSQPSQGKANPSPASGLKVGSASSQVSQVSSSAVDHDHGAQARSPSLQRSPPGRPHVTLAPSTSATSLTQRMHHLELHDLSATDGDLKAHLPKPKPKPATAIELYDAAVVSEREGRLNDALVNYRAAFKIDAEIDRTYHRLTSRASQESRSSTSTSNVGPHSPADFKFERTIQLAPDYSADREFRTAQTGASHPHDLHPSSTAFLYDSLARSFAENAYDPSKAEHVHAKATESEIDVALERIAFHPDDPEAPSPLGSLPREVLLLVLHHLVLSSVIPPAQHTPVNSEDPAKLAARKKGPRKLTLAEHTRNLEVAFDVPYTHLHRPWRTDVEALERFARTCRLARILTLDAGLWRDLCRRVYVAPYQTREEANQIVAQHGTDWRRCFIEHPCIRFDGAFISVVTYLRRGENSSWYSPTHLITFYRYLRFYPNGLVVSLLTVDPPAAVVRILNPALRVKGLTFGRWELRGDHVDLWELIDPSVEETSRKYSFRMELKLRSTNRGWMNKLDMISLATERRLSGEVEPVPIKPTKPYYL
ncbi:BZ3500_MvSof-1268-A1-R1_Chr6-3g08869 [Microbotryum saponariae]|uniref:BZ3500_MvSof-1268-A1-R1_Chr6-3g08869 protein n=1 Tax=Microbotryum saponariae TaxID=289078 RepID=A0A2X0LCZ7_9BASI|nr:BZ3500_MvSof-1268-A1-R1_Chr6-3g08869 [Microbotryum saponariae]SDA07470.1 BZ3501_MvSof-1269-A2-R1_Chr6-2g08572 [Microbotryum saponariae]